MSGFDGPRGCDDTLPSDVTRTDTTALVVTATPSGSPPWFSQAARCPGFSAKGAGDPKLMTPLNGPQTTESSTVPSCTLSPSQQASILTVSMVTTGAKAAYAVEMGIQAMDTEKIIHWDNKKFVL